LSNSDLHRINKPKLSGVEADVPKASPAELTLLNPSILSDAESLNDSLLEVGLNGSFLSDTGVLYYNENSFSIDEIRSKKPNDPPNSTLNTHCTAILNESR
jgi:hypothetical protein